MVNTLVEALLEVQSVSSNLGQPLKMMEACQGGTCGDVFLKDLEFKSQPDQWTEEDTLRQLQRGMWWAPAADESSIGYNQLQNKRRATESNNPRQGQAMAWSAQGESPMGRRQETAQMLHTQRVWGNLFAEPWLCRTPDAEQCSPDGGAQQVGNDGNSPEHGIDHTARKGDKEKEHDELFRSDPALKFLAALAEAKKAVQTSPNELFRTIHQWAIANNRNYENSTRIATIKQLLGHEGVKRNLDMPDNQGRTALCYAVSSRQHHAARMLVESGADPFGTDDNNSPLRLACIGTKGDPGVGTFTFLMWLLRYLRRTGKDEEVKSCLNRDPPALLVACCRKRQQSETVRLLLEYGASPNAMEKRSGWTALHYAAKRDHVATVRLLLEAGADVNIRKADSLTPLHMASLNGNSHVVALLLRFGADPTLLTGDLDDERPVWSHKTAADLADIEGAPQTALVIRRWAYWNQEEALP